jgi:Na+/H+ antiporter NhaD/arsenite permease-like protein
MESVIITVFVIGYILIAFEHQINVNKTATAILTAVICWTLLIVSRPTEPVLSSEHFSQFTEVLKIESGDNAPVQSAKEIFPDFVLQELQKHLSSIAEILFFLMCAMTIVELIDAHHGFKIITEKIRTKNPRSLMWLICWVTFFLSAVLDNLTTTIVMVSLIRKIVPDKGMRLFFVGMIVIAANAGGAWTPIGDVTTTMLWIGGQISTFAIVRSLFIPSVVCMLVPLIYLSFRLKGTLGFDGKATEEHADKVKGGKLMLWLGLAIMLGVPVFKIITHLPPYVGMLAGLGILWVVSELIHSELDDAVRKEYSAAGALSRIDVPSILFFLGILLAVGALESMMTLQRFSQYLSTSIGDQRLIVLLIGILSAIIDNVPLVAATMGMYSLNVYATDHALWHFLAYCAGTGGSILIIGSAAGVAAMGMEKIDFIWYLKKISLLAFIAYVGGALTYLAMNQFQI